MTTKNISALAAAFVAKATETENRVNNLRKAGSAEEKNILGCAQRIIANRGYVAAINAIDGIPLSASSLGVISC